MPSRSPGVPAPSRRQFVSTVGAALVAGAVPAPLLGAGRDAPRGLAPDPGDFTLDAGLTYLQTGSLGPSPRPVMQAVIDAWKELERNPVFYGYGPHEQAMEVVRAKAATFIGCTTDELVITNSTTEGMNWVADGLTFAPGDHILTTDQEHPGGRVCWDHVARRKGVVLDVVPIATDDHDPAAIVERFAQRITPRTRALSFSHLLSSTGLRMPVAALSALARSRGCLSIVDGAQAVGGVDVNVRALGCDVYTTSGHKWLLAPKGTGLLYLNASLGTTIDPIALQSGRQVYSASSGVCSLPSVHGLGAAIDYINRIGIAKVEAHNLGLREQLVAGLRRVAKVRLVSASAGPMASPLVSYVLPDAVRSHDLYQRLMTTHRVMVKVVPGQWFNGHRISTHLFNTAADVERLLAALRRELA